MIILYNIYFIAYNKYFVYNTFNLCSLDTEIFPKHYKSGAD